MKATFFDDEMIKVNKTVQCPNCNTDHKISLNDCEVSCEICGEHIETELVIDTEDFIWHPNLLF